VHGEMFPRRVYNYPLVFDHVAIGFVERISCLLGKQRCRFCFAALRAWYTGRRTRSIVYEG
jgi:hypothetical protein